MSLYFKSRCKDDDHASCQEKFDQERVRNACWRLQYCTNLSSARVSALPLLYENYSTSSLPMYDRKVQDCYHRRTSVLGERKVWETHYTQFLSRAKSIRLQNNSCFNDSSSMSFAATVSESSATTDGVFSMDSFDDKMSEDDLTFNKNKSFRQIFTDYHNNEAIADGNSSAFLGETLSFRDDRGLLLRDLNAFTRSQRIAATSSTDYTLASVSGSTYSENSSFSGRAVMQSYTPPSGLMPIKDYQYSEWITPYLAASLSTLIQSDISTLGNGSSYLDKSTYNPFMAYELDPISISSTIDSSSFINRTIVLRLNFLFEYETVGNTSNDPLGFVALCNASICRLEPRLLRIEAHSSSMSKNKRELVFYILTKDREQADLLEDLLLVVAKLSLHDLYQIGNGSKSCNDTLDSSILGQSKFASVQKAYRKHPKYVNYNPCALKVINKSEFRKKVERGQERPDALYRESSIQALLTAACKDRGLDNKACPIVQLYSIFETADDFVLEMELMSRNNLFHELSRVKTFGGHKASSIVRQLLEAVQFCQSIGIVHRDIKLSNISLSASSEKQTNLKSVKLMDFGMARIVDGENSLSGRCGTPGYVAPEILKAGPQESYGMNVDIYSIGVVAYTLLCGYEPFYGETNEELLAQNKSGIVDFVVEDWCEINPAAQELVELMMDPDPNTRISVSAALKHPWLADNAKFYRSESFSSDDTCTTSEDDDVS